GRDKTRTDQHGTFLHFLVADQTPIAVLQAQRRHAARSLPSQLEGPRRRPGTAHHDPSRRQVLSSVEQPEMSKMDGYIVAGPPSTFRFQPNDSRTVRFPAIFALRVDFVRSVRGDAQVSQLRRTHEHSVASPTPAPHPIDLSML